VPDRLVAHDVDVGVVDVEGREPVGRGFGLGGGVADEAAPAVVDEAIEPGGPGAVEGAVFAGPAAEALLQPQAVEGASTEELQAVRFPCPAQAW
jgi:hypothetical protein